MHKRIYSGLLILALGILPSLPALAEPSIQQVYQAAESGKLKDAETMMQEVLRAHPGSAKAHFVEAEILAKERQLQSARQELATAERLAPDMSFAKPQAVENLRGLLGEATRIQHQQGLNQAAGFAPQRQSSFPWSLLIVGLGVIGFVIWASRFMARRNEPTVIVPAPAYGGGYPGPQAPYGTSGPMPYGGGPVVGGGGMGGGILGGLATGAAVGAGMVAGEALMHRVLGDHESSRIIDSGLGNSSPLGEELSPSAQAWPNDLGGNDFGLNDTSSWDSGGSDNSSDWS